MARRKGDDTPEQRERGRAERRRLWGVNSKLVLDPKDVDAYSSDPVQSLEDLRGEILARLKAIQESTDDDKLAASIGIAMLKLSSMGVGKGDVALLIERETRPDVSHLSDAQLEKIASQGRKNGTGT